MIHRAARGGGPLQLRRLFPLQSNPSAHAEHAYQIVNLAGDCPQEYMARSAFGYVDIYNRLPGDIVTTLEVKAFQRLLQMILVDRAIAGDVCWPDCLRQIA